MTYNWTIEDYKELISQQKLLLENSLNNYDGGCRSEYLRIAVIIRVLVHDTASSISLLNQANLKDQIRYYSTHNRELMNYDIISSLCTANVSGNLLSKETNVVTLVPRLYEADLYARFIDFDTWWNETVIFSGQSSLDNRKNLILGASNKLGGAHIDREPSIILINLTKGTGLKQIVKYGSTETFNLVKGDWISCSIRQIGFEILYTLNNCSI